jgi:2-C-methyl-D-erythritol 4-phosphate cytidylyltransferase
MNVAIIVAAGQGKRMKSERRAKQFLELAGTPIIMHTLKVFERCETIQEIIVVLPAQEVYNFLPLANKSEWRKLARFVPGGQTRASSVKRGLQAVRAATAEIIAVHDGVRPFVTVDEITRTIEAATECGAAVLAAPVIDTIKEVESNFVQRTLERARLCCALTPQCFRYELLRRAYEQSDETIAQATDDSSLVERLGARVAIVEGSARNIKITCREDLALAETILRESERLEAQETE